MALNIKYSPEFTGDCYQSLPRGECLMGSIAVSDSGHSWLEGHAPYGRMESRTGLEPDKIENTC